MNLLAYSTSKENNAITIKCSDGNACTTTTWKDACDFLLEHCDFAVVWNIDQFAETIISLLPPSLQKDTLTGGRYYFENRKIYYQPTKLFGLNFINFYGLSRYSDKPITDCKELLTLANQVIDAFKNVGVTEVTKLTSPVAVFADLLGSIPYPRTNDLPETALALIDATAKVMTREWRDTFVLGHWDKDEITDYDLCAAYPSLVAKLPDITNAKFFSSDTIPDKYSWGELQGILTINKPISPFYCEKVNSYPIGTWNDSITTDQLWLLNKYQMGTFQFKHGDFFLLPDKYILPFKATMDNLYKARSINELTSRIAKGISVGIWGKFAERYENRLGDFFNSIYARMVTSRCIVLVADFIYRNKIENDVVSILVDGVLATKRLNLPDQKVLGSWRQNTANPAIVLSELFQWIGDKKPGYETYDTLLEKMRAKPDTSVYGEVDIKLVDYKRKFNNLPKTGRQLLENKYKSEPIEVK